MTLASGCRPDVRAVRLGIDRARAEVGLQRANRIDDVYLFYDPITIQDNSPYHQPSAQSWAVGLTFSLPVFNRNQGNIARAQSNVAQTRVELESMERRVASEVRLAEREYQYSKRSLERIERILLPQAEERLQDAAQNFDSGAMGVEDFQEHLEEAAMVLQSHREAVVRHRRSMLDINTAVGMRLLP